MTLYNLKNFSVPASAGTKETCQRDGHAFADRKGKCIRCGERIRDTGWSEGTQATPPCLKETPIDG